ncbi:MAG: hypothetical protein ISF22_10765 [Methanomassiliicoccus sp.]|nr:hypothetical protein [Methanomassiliicoccus sp.]
MSATRGVLTFAILAIVSLTLAGSATADWSGSASFEGPVHINFDEDLRVTVTNTGGQNMVVNWVAVTIVWPGTPTYYRVFDGAATIAPGETREFVSAPERMPSEVEGTYPYTVYVLASGPDGSVVEKRFTGTVEASKYSISAFGVPEIIFVPAMLTILPILATLLIFRLERAPGWPFFRAVPRFGGHRSRRT